jgi:hypothetical protein
MSDAPFKRRFRDLKCVERPPGRYHRNPAAANRSFQRHSSNTEKTAAFPGVILVANRITINEGDGNISALIIFA